MASVMQSYLERFDTTSLLWIDGTLATEPDISRTRLVQRFLRAVRLAGAQWQLPENGLRHRSAKTPRPGSDSVASATADPASRPGASTASRTVRPAATDMFPG